MGRVTEGTLDSNEGDQDFGEETGKGHKFGTAGQ